MAVRGREASDATVGSCDAKYDRDDRLIEDHPRVGRPTITIKPEQVGDLKSQGLSWRRIAKALRIGTATAMRLFRSIDKACSNTQGVGPKTGGHIQ